MTGIANSPIMDGIEIQHVTAYLGASGWRRRAAFPRPEVLVFDGPDDDEGEPIEAVIPSSTRFSDFRRRLEDLLNTLSILEDRPPLEIALDMLNPSVDRVRTRVLSEFASAGSIPLSFASVLVRGLRDLVAAAACAEDEPRRFYTKATRIGGEHANQWRMGQTQLGSFVATLECPVSPPPPRASGNPAPPFERRVTERIMRGLGRLHTAVLDGRVDSLFEGYRDGLNANMCEALLSLRSGPGDLRLEFGVSWSKRVPEPSHLPRVVLVEERGFEFLDQTARTLREADESVERELRGYIVKLATSDVAYEDGNLEIEESRTATLQFVERKRRQHAHMRLSPEDYRIACEAHRDRKEVSVRGRLERDGKQWRISGISAFGTVDQSTDIEKLRMVKQEMDR